MSELDAEIGAVMRRVRQGFRDIQNARQSAGVRPGEPLLGLGINVVVSDALPIAPSHREDARRIVRRGLHDAFPWLAGDPGPRPGDPTHALLIGGNLLTSADYANKVRAIAIRPVKPATANPTTPASTEAAGGGA